MMRPLLVLTVMAGTLLVGCGTDPEPGSDAATTTDTAHGIADGADTAIGGDGVAADATAGATPDTESAKPFFELGTNITGKNTRKFYTTVAEGGTLNVELGPQGLWMVVLAFKTKNMLTSPLYLSGNIEVEGNDSGGKLALKKQKTILSDDGFSYYYNFWLVVKNDKLPLPSAPADVDGKTATVVLNVTDADGLKHVETLHVTLSGGPHG